MRVNRALFAFRVLQPGEQVLLHNIQVLKHGAFGLGRVALDDGFENLLVPAAGHFMTRRPGPFDLLIVEKLPVEGYAEKKLENGFIDLQQSGIVFKASEGVMKQPARIARGRVMREVSMNGRSHGVRFFAWLMTRITGAEITDPASGFRAFSPHALRLLELRENQFHASEVTVAAAKLGLRVREVPCTFRERLSGSSKKPAFVRYGYGYTRTLLRTWLG